AQARAKSSRPRSWAGLRWSPPAATEALSSPLNASTKAGTASPAANRTTMPRPTRRRPAGESVCSAWRAPLGPPRMAMKNTPTPPPKPLAQAVHDALAAGAPSGVSASVQLTNHLLEGANIASGEGEAGQLASSPLLSGASGRLWIAPDGRLRIELQAERGDTQILYDAKTLEAYDAATNTLYRYAVPQHERAASDQGSGSDRHQAPSVAEIEKAIARLSEHANVSGAKPDDVAGRPAYTVRVSPKEAGSLLGGTELSWDAVSGVP